MPGCGTWTSSRWRWALSLRGTWTGPSSTPKRGDWTCTWTSEGAGGSAVRNAGGGGCPAHDTSPKTWRHLNFFQHEAYLHARVPRVACEACGVKLVEVPWARSGSGFTLLFEAMVLTLVRSMPVAAVARLMGEYDSRL
jgi:hypothetical protein